MQKKTFEIPYSKNIQNKHNIIHLYFQTTDAVYQHQTANCLKRFQNELNACVCTYYPKISNIKKLLGKAVS